MSKLKLRMLAATLLAAAAFGAGPAGAGGITLYEVGSMDVGLAGAGYAARAQDASTVFTNPAGMTRLAGRQLTAGVQALYGDLDFSIGAGTTAALGAGGGGNPIGWFPGGGLFYSHSLSPDTKLGVAVTGNFGAVVKYDEDWVGRYHLKEGTLLGVSIVPSVATRVDPHWSLGASLVAMRGTFDTAVAVNNLAGPDGQLALDDTAWGYGVRLGVVYEPTATSRFGFTYNSPVSLDFSAPADWSGVGPLLTALLRSRGLYDAQVDLGVTVPQGVMASAYHEIDRDWAILGSVGWQQWSKFGRVDVGVDASNPVSLTSDLRFRDTWHVSAGAQRRLGEAWMLNFGVGYDSSFQESGSVALALPTNATWRFALGARQALSRDLDWGASFVYALQDDLDVNTGGSVPVAVGGRGTVTGSFERPRTLFFALSLNWRF